MAQAAHWSLPAARTRQAYYRLFRTGRQVGRLRRLRLLASAPRLAAETELPPPDFSPEHETVVVFRNLVSGNERTYFCEIVGHSEIVRKSLIDMTRPKYRPALPTHPHIAIHVRGGDFSQPSSLEEIKSGRHNLQIPADWYVKMLKGLRKRLGDTLPAIVYSDFADEELVPLLSLLHVKRSPYREAISDMLAMSQANAIISSGSGFSRWASYLGQVPRLCFPGQRTVRTLGPVVDGTDMEPECEVAGEIPEGFYSHVLSRALVAGGALRV
ncbi:MAG: hypothetical protein GXP05_15240 [Alphaproteobacteria bacterium]|nr:hypothetical protein [Alphaproteobacteria bacterium]